MKILFVCRGNVGRSQMAAALLQKYTDNRLEVASAGTKLSGPEQPIGELMPATNEVIEVMNEIGVDVSNNLRRQITEEMATAYDRIILTVDDNDPVPEYLLNNPRVVRWDVPDPKGKDLEFTRGVREQLSKLVKRLIANEE